MRVCRGKGNVCRSNGNPHIRFLATDCLDIRDAFFVPVAPIIDTDDTIIST